MESIVPSIEATILVSIFIASIVSKLSPSLTCCPFSTKTLIIVPGILAPISSLSSALDWSEYSWNYN